MNVAKGGQLGAIAQDDVELFKLYDYWCMQHPKPIQMEQRIVEQLNGNHVIMIKACLKCLQIVTEGEYDKSSTIPNGGDLNA